MEKQEALMHVRACENQVATVKKAQGWWVNQARENGASWAEVGEACKITRQAAHARWVPKEAMHPQEH